MTYDIFYKEKEKLDKIASNIQHYKDCISTQETNLKQPIQSPIFIFQSKEDIKGKIHVFKRCREYWKRAYYRQLQKLGTYAK